MRRFGLTVLAGYAALVAAAAIAQESTERYVPIGASPGISGEHSTIGRITAVDREARTITVQSADTSKTFKVTAATDVWLDRSGWKMTNLDGSYSDCAVGQRAEIMYRKDDRSTADWIKIEARARR